MLETEVVPNTDAKRLELLEGNLIPNQMFDVSAAAAQRTPTHYKIRPGDLIIDQYGTVHTVMAADHESITLRDTVYDPTTANDTNGWVPDPHGMGASTNTTVYIWYVPAAAYGSGNYAQYRIGPAARSPLRAVVAIPNAVR
jgi:hypothetical protein